MTAFEQSIDGITGSATFVISLQNVGNTAWPNPILNRPLENGFRIYLDPVDALLEQNGHIIGPGTRAHLSIRRKEFLADPSLTDCEENKQLGLDSLGHYTPSRCILECMWKMFYQNCRCVEMQTYAINPYKLCMPMDFISCSDSLGYSAKFPEFWEQCQKNCPNTCTHVELSSKISYAPMYQNPNFFKAMLVNDSQASWISIYYDSLEYTVIKEMPMLSPVRLFSDVAAQVTQKIIFIITIIN